ncbi:putative membrane protein [Wickerhamomyces ciferrii]|uniref:Membrane protein n=1 Tax=Wickerhamomyces ciferrii (strain ATCC 14091 / BCRC 22168 / CBS 111 / JCM 3599 / NBRC 0793 / NRRL Y-1031 F-60-10) TaxID=1206466 RepID=K0KEK5_WICCF|nr:uncharacterized protein BN7_196 [Wickerhamomyces ciferrii]CCH40662.1 putative membrane protein [Wickerhamomyces ciferrii]
MNKITYSNSQRYHNTLITRLIQVIINPLILFGGYSLIILVFYHIVCLKINDRYSFNDSKSSNVSVMGIDLSLENNEFDLGKVINNDTDTYVNSLQGSIEEYLNNTTNILNFQHDYIKQNFDSVLEMKWNESEQVSQQQDKFIDSLKSLNSSIMDQLTQDKEKIDNAKNNFDSAVYVGDKVDTSNLTLNFNDIQDSLSNAINGFDQQNDNSSLLQLYDSKDDFNDELNDVFDDVKTKLKDIDTSIDIDDVSYMLKLEPQLIDSQTAQNNGSNSTISNFNIKQFKRDSTTNLVIIGGFLCIVYFLIMLYQYFRFRYQMNYTVSHMVDLEKTDSKFDYLGVLQKTNEPTVTMFMDIQGKIFGKLNDVKSFWINSFMIGDISNVPYMFMGCMFLFIVWLSLTKLEIHDVSLDITNDQSILVEKSYNLTNFDELKSLNHYELLGKHINNINNQTQYEIQSLNDSLDDLYSKFNITHILSIPTPKIHAQNFTISLPTSQSTQQLLNHLQTTKFQVKSNINVSNFQTSNIVQTLSQIISSTLIKIVRTALIIAAILFFFVLFLGILYSFTI